jgi:endonuclease YncB( thermonuclease family)
MFQTRFVWLIVMIFLLAGCSQNRDAAGNSAGVIQVGTLPLPTQQPTAAPSPVNTRVLPLDVLTPPARPSVTAIPDEALALVVEVIDGDTIAVVMDGDPLQQAYQVRYLGVDAPPNDDSNPWGVVAYETNHQLTNLKVVRLVRDETDFNDEGQLLRYVYLNDELLSLTLAEQGLVRAAVEAPDTAFEQEILAAEARAREEQLGLWGQRPPTPTVQSARTIVETAEPITPTVVLTTTITSPTDEAEAAEETPVATEEAATDEATAEPTVEATDTPETP